MVSTCKGTYETPPPKPSRRRSLNEEVAEADAIPQGEKDSDSYWSGSETSGNSASESLAVASSSGSASVLSGGSTMGLSGGSPKALSISSAGGRIEPDFSQSVASSVPRLHSTAIARTLLPSIAIGSSAGGRNEPDLLQSVVPPVLHFTAISHTSLPSTAIGSSSRDETGISSGLRDALDFVVASTELPGPDTSSVVTAGDDRRVVVAGTGSVSLPSFSSADSNFHVPRIAVNQFVSPKRFARHAPDSANNSFETSSRVFPLWFRQSIETGEDITYPASANEDTSGADSDSDRSSSLQMVLYSPPAIRSCTVLVEVGDSEQEGQSVKSSKKA
ncbi:hypothetical protein FB451DRAFT_784517 [Mycena latifolia]|nr:hypothetical protein FB451DRAFT_784517 [Mycena latifolia]